MENVVWTENENRYKSEYMPLPMGLQFRKVDFQRLVRKL